MPVIAAIDVGSNALRLAVGSVNEDRRLKILETAREAVRLGSDVFKHGSISERSLGNLAEAMNRFRDICRSHQASITVAIGTSALREARNRDMVIDAVLRRTGVELTAIGPEEEARLVHLAVSKAVDLRGKRAVIIDIGGGSMEATLTDDGRIMAVECFLAGPVRLLQKIDQNKAGEQKFQKMVREFTATYGQRLEKMSAGGRIDLAVGVGGNIEALGALRQDLLGKKSPKSLDVDELDRLVKLLSSHDLQARVEKLGLNPDRADVIVPASIVLRETLLRLGADRMNIPGVGLREGLLYDIISELFDEATSRHREQAVNSAMQLGRKYGFDEPHALTVARYALLLFDAAQQMHGLDRQHRDLLEVAALLHDVGQFISANGHHKHSYYLIMSSPIVGLNARQREMIANIARYHRKASPSVHHQNFQRLDSKDRVAVSKLAAILRLADGLDAEHAALVQNVEIECGRQKLKLRLKGRGDLLLAKWSVDKKANLFEEVFGAEVVVLD